MDIKSRWKWIGVLTGVAFLVLIYKYYDPYQSSIFPKCPFLQLTGYECAGCGSQRALHHLLNFEIRQAAAENLLMVLFVPYIIAGSIIDLLPQPGETLLLYRKRFFGTKAIYVVLTVIVAFWIFRNVIPDLSGYLMFN